jgi:hypothetical protein
VVLYGCETWSLILREEHRLRMFENNVLRTFGPKRDEVTGVEGNYIMRSFITCTLRQIQLEWSSHFVSLQMSGTLMKPYGFRCKCTVLDESVWFWTQVYGFGCKRTVLHTSNMVLDCTALHTSVGFWMQMYGFTCKCRVLDANIRVYMQVYGFRCKCTGLRANVCFPERLMSPTIYPALRAPPPDTLDLGSMDSNSPSTEEQPSVVTVTSPIDLPGPESTI